MLALLDLFSLILVYIFACPIADLLGFVTFNTAFCALAVQFTIFPHDTLCACFFLIRNIVCIYHLLLILLEISL